VLAMHAQSTPRTTAATAARSKARMRALQCPPCRRARSLASFPSRGGSRYPLTGGGCSGFDPQWPVQDGRPPATTGFWSRPSRSVRAKWAQGPARVAAERRSGRWPSHPARGGLSPPPLALPPTRARALMGRPARMPPRAARMLWSDLISCPPPSRARLLLREAHRRGSSSSRTL